MKLEKSKYAKKENGSSEASQPKRKKAKKSETDLHVNARDICLILII